MESPPWRDDSSAPSQGVVDVISPDAAFCLCAADSPHEVGTVYFFKNHQFACWDIGEDRLLPGYPRDTAGEWPGLLEPFPASRLRGALHVPDWGKKIYFFFEGRSQVLVWDMNRRAVDAAPIDRRLFLPTILADGDLTIVCAPLADNRRVIYGFQGYDYTRWMVGPSFPATEDEGFPRKIAADWKDGLVLAPRSGVYVDWHKRSAAHSNRKIYFFMGDLYLRWDVPSNTRNYRLDILAGWKGWPAFA
jgi:hypothetical protein